LAQGDSLLAARWHDDETFRRECTAVVEALEGFYRKMGTDALHSFERRLARWVRNPGDDYIGFLGELSIADRLRRHNVPHHFVPETESPTPDFELTIISTPVYFEVKTLQEDPYKSFYNSVKKEIEQIPSGCWVTIDPLKVTAANRDALAARAVQEIRVALSNGDYGPILYRAESGSYHILFRPGLAPDSQSTRVTWFRFEWWESRMQNGVPYLEFKLAESLTESIEQFRIYRPTFFIWCNFDKSLMDFDVHVQRVLQQRGSREFSDVAGIVVDFMGWVLFENPLYPAYSELAGVGLFDAIRALK